MKKFMKTTTPRPTGFTDRAARLTLGTALALAAAGAWAFAAGILGSLSYRYPFEYGETIMLLPILNMRENPWIYGDILKMPHHLMPYHPLYLYLAYAVSLVTGPSYICGRIVTGAAAVVAAGLIALICRRRAGAGWAGSMFAGFLFLASPFLLGEAIHVKPDVTALALALTGFYLGTGDGRGRCVGSAVFFALAFMTKQNYVLAAAAVLMGYLIRLKLREAWVFTATLAALSLAGVGILAWGSGGQYWSHAFLNVNVFYSVKIFWINLGKIGPTIGAVLACGAASSAVLIAWRKSAATATLSVYFCFTALMTFNAFSP